MHALVLLPGTLCNERLWTHQIEGLADIADCTVPDLSQDATLPALAQRVLNAAPEKFALAGFSMGAIVAFEAFRQAPERITHFAVIDGKAHADEPEHHQRRLDTLTFIQTHDRPATLKELLLPNYFHPDNSNDPALIRCVTEMALSFGPEVHERQIRALLDRPDSRPLLPSIEVPALALCGEADRLCLPEWHREMAAQMPNADCVIVPNSGHFAPLEQPEIVTQAMRRWLSR